jgi:SPP1 family predicted phage head-tail adaptor
MRAGRIRNRVTIEEKTVVQNDYGEETITWSEYDVVWGSIEPLRGREFAEAERAGAEVTTRIVMRYRSGVVPEMRATEGDNTYDIISVVNVDNRDREMLLMCREVL